MRLHRRLVAALLMAGALMPAVALAGRTTAEVVAPVRAAYQFDGGIEQATRALRNIHNHLEADPTAQITVVALAAGIDFLLVGAETPGGYPFELTVQELQARGVKFEVCNNTLQTRGIATEKLVDNVTVVPSGVAELARLQAREHYAYIKP